jgi:hypothetical protein
MSNPTAKLSHEFTYAMSCGPAHDLGNGPLGHRQYYELTSATIEGPRLSAKLIGTGGDWMLIGTDGFMRMDVRIQFETQDGAIICAHYFGPAEANAKLRQAASEGTSTDFSDHLIRSHWLLEAGDPRYAWVNQAVFVGEGRVRSAGSGQIGFEHRVYRVG